MEALGAVLEAVAIAGGEFVPAAAAEAMEAVTDVIPRVSMDEAIRRRLTFIG